MLLKQFRRGSGGYLAVNLMIADGKWRQVYVHLLVLENFDRPRPQGMQARHGPGGKYDNRYPENLQWGTPRENHADKYRDGTALIGIRHHRAKLTDEIVRDCRVRRAQGVSYAQLAIEYDVTLQCIHQAVSGKNWSHVT